jgi:hypothetical protein
MSMPQTTDWPDFVLLAIGVVTLFCATYLILTLISDTKT